MLSTELPLIFKNQDFLVVDKPVGISVHNFDGTIPLIERLKTQLQITEIYPVHRLDKETSGLQILALNEASARDLANVFQAREVEKIYLGIVRGEWKSKAGMMSQPLTDKAEGRSQPAGQAKHRVPCQTGYTVVDSNKFFTLMRYHLITGRQHQIRKHMAISGHQLVGDPRYGDPKYNARMAKIYGVTRMFLHCSRLTMKDLVFESPAPSEFSLLMKPGRSTESTT